MSTTEKLNPIIIIFTFSKVTKKQMMMPLLRNIYTLKKVRRQNLRSTCNCVVQEGKNPKNAINFPLRSKGGNQSKSCINGDDESTDLKVNPRRGATNRAWTSPPLPSLSGMHEINFRRTHKQ